MNEHDTDQFEKCDPQGTMNEQDAHKPEERGRSRLKDDFWTEEYVPPKEPNILVGAASEAARPAPAQVVEVEGKTVVDQIAHFIERFVFLKTKSLYKLLGLWVVATHMHAEFEYMGYIFACSPEPQSGKSRLLEVLDLLGAHSSGILVSPTEAVLFRTAEGHTQLLDEVDGWSNREVLRSVLNAGFHKGANVKRMHETASGLDVRSFPVFAPRALAGIGSKILDATTRDRTFQFEMVRQMRDERREKFRARTAEPEANVIISEVAKWVAENRHRVAELYKRADFPYLQEFRDRTQDVTEPLAAILEVAYEKSAGLEQARTELLQAVALTRKDQVPLGDDHRILATLAKLAKSEDPLVGNATELAERCAPVLGESPDSLDVSRVLRRFGFEPKSIRKDGAPKYRYSIPFSALEELLKRYGSPEENDKDPEEAVVSVAGVGTCEGSGT